MNNVQTQNEGWRLEGDEGNLLIACPGRAWLLSAADPTYDVKSENPTVWELSLPDHLSGSDISEKWGPFFDGIGFTWFTPDGSVRRIHPYFELDNPQRGPQVKWWRGWHVNRGEGIIERTLTLLRSATVKSRQVKTPLYGFLRSTSDGGVEVVVMKWGEDKIREISLGKCRDEDGRLVSGATLEGWYPPVLCFQKNEMGTSIPMIYVFHKDKGAGRRPLTEDQEFEGFRLCTNLKASTEPTNRVNLAVVENIVEPSVLPNGVTWVAKCADNTWWTVTIHRKGCSAARYHGNPPRSSYVSKVSQRFLVDDGVDLFEYKIDQNRTSLQGQYEHKSMFGDGAFYYPLPVQRRREGGLLLGGEMDVVYHAWVPPYGPSKPDTISVASAATPMRVLAMHETIDQLRILWRSIGPEGGSIRLSTRQFAVRDRFWGDNQ